MLFKLDRTNETPGYLVKLQILFQLLGEGANQGEMDAAGLQIPPSSLGLCVGFTQRVEIIGERTPIPHKRSK